jgi:hypothetical protein
MRQMTVETTFNQKLLRGVQGGGFLEKSPPGAGGKNEKANKFCFEWF